MAQNAALSGLAGMSRVRVRTPGKHIVLFLFVPVVVVAVASGVWLNIQSHRSAVAALEYRTTVSGLKTAYFTLPEMLVDLSPDLDGRTAYLKLRVSLALRDDKPNQTAEQIESVQPAVMERLTFFLRELRPEDFRGSAEMLRVKTEMLRRVNLEIAPATADEIIIEEIVIQ